MKYLVALVCLLILLSGSSCRQSDIRTVEIKVPGLKNQACAQIIANAVGKQVGVQSKGISMDFERKIVYVQYESLVTAWKNLEFAIAEAGFQANEVPANPDAYKALPPECK